MDEISTLQIDHTSRCNLRCPQCARTSGGGGINPRLPSKKDLTVEQYRTILNPFRHRKIKIFHCGNYGDAVASPTFIDTLDFSMKFAPKAFYCIITNGSLHGKEWWANLGEKLAINPDNQVCFSIDGLEDTNGIYRIGSSFQKIIDNLSAFIKAGGKARWDYLVFAHNSHQIDRARSLAAKLGVHKFNLKYTSRFIATDKEQYTPSATSKHAQVTDMPNNPNLVDYLEIKKTYSNFAEYAATCIISCKYKKTNAIYVDFETRLWPCCWVGQPLFAEDTSLPQAVHISNLMTKYGADFNRLDLYGWDLLKHDYFNRYLEQSWNKDFSDKDTPRHFTCGRTCGEKYEFSSGYGKNKKMELT